MQPKRPTPVAETFSSHHPLKAGFPTDLDLAFSRAQRDKVYEQHLMRERGAQLWRWLRGGAQLCVCEIAAEHEDLDPHRYREIKNGGP
jgi:hypothetical protein